jgi:branched-chain amino acid transport system substrate-binding protein
MGKPTRLFGTALAVLMCAIVAVGCGDSKEDTASGGGGGEAASSEPIKIASLNWAAGPIKDLGDEEQFGVELAVEEANAAGGVLGRQIELTRYDHGFAGDDVIASARKAMSDGNVAIVGGQETSVCQALISVTKPKNLPLTATVCGQAGDELPDYEAAVHTRAALYGGLVATGNWMAEQGYKSVQMVAGDNTYNQLVSAALPKILDPQGVKFEKPIFGPFASAENRVEISKAVATKPDLLFLGVYGQPVVVNAVKEARALGYDGDILVNEAALTPLTAEAMGEEGAGVFGTQGWAEDPEVETSKAFGDAYRAKFDMEPTWLSENGYLAMKIIIAAIEQADSADPEKFGAEMRNVTVPLVNGGDVEFDEDGRRIAPEWYTTKNEGGKLVLGTKVAMPCQAACPEVGLKP